MLEKLLQDMKLFGALENLPQLNKVKDPQEYARLLLKAEYDFKNNRSIQRKLKTAKFPYIKQWTDLEYSLNPKIDFETIHKVIQRKKYLVGTGIQYGQDQNDSSRHRKRPSRASRPSRSAG